MPISSKQALCIVPILLAGCATTPEPVIEVRTVKMAVPVPCREPVPERPEFPMDGLRPGVSLDGFVAAALAERLTRDGYELRLETALRACTSP